MCFVYVNFIHLFFYVLVLFFLSFQCVFVFKRFQIFLMLHKDSSLQKMKNIQVQPLPSQIYANTHIYTHVYKHTHTHAHQITLI